MLAHVTRRLRTHEKPVLPSWSGLLSLRLIHILTNTPGQLTPEREEAACGHVHVEPDSDVGFAALVPGLFAPLLPMLILFGCQGCRLSFAQAPGAILTSGWKNSSCCRPTALICSCQPGYLLLVPHLVAHSDKWIV